MGLGTFEDQEYACWDFFQTDWKLGKLNFRIDIFGFFVNRRRVQENYGCFSNALSEREKIYEMLRIKTYFNYKLGCIVQ